MTYQIPLKKVTIELTDEDAKRIFEKLSFILYGKLDAVLTLSDVTIRLSPKKVKKWYNILSKDFKTETETREYLLSMEEVAAYNSNFRRKKD